MLGLGLGLQYPRRGIGGGAVDERLIISVNATDGTFTIPTTGGGYLYDIDTNDGYTANGITGNHTITFPSGIGIYDVYISGSFPQFYFNNTGDKLKLLEIKNLGIYGIGSTNQINAFFGCNNVLFTMTDIGHFENVTNFQFTFINCTLLTSFPIINTSGGENFSSTFRGLRNIVSFPLLNYNNATTLAFAWSNMTSLTTFPANAFDFCLANNYAGAFDNTNLSSESINNILISIDTAGVTNGDFRQTGGEGPSGLGIEAYRSLVRKGWTITTSPLIGDKLVNTYTGGEFGTSLRLVDDSYAGGLIRVRAWDNVALADRGQADILPFKVGNEWWVDMNSKLYNLDIYATGTRNLTTDNTLADLVSVGVDYYDGLVPTIYDQVGGNHFEQGTANNQGILISNGEMNLLNGKPVILASVSSDVYKSIYVPNGGGKSTFVVGGNGGNAFVIFAGDATNADFGYVGVDTNTSTALSSRYTIIDSKINNIDIIPGITTREDVYNLTIGQFLLSSNDVMSFYVGNFVFGYLSLPRPSFQEVVRFSNQLERVGKETNIKNAFNIIF